MLQTLLDIILYIPKKIVNHFEDYNYFKQEYKKQVHIIKNQQLLFKRIIVECEYYMKQNQSVSYNGFKKIKNLANTFPNDTKF